MTVENILKYLREKPIKLEDNLNPCIIDYFDSLENKKFYFREVVRKIEVNVHHELHREPLFRARDFGLLEKSYYSKGNGAKILENSKIKAEQHLIDSIYLRVSILSDLEKVDQFLKIHSENKLCLVLLSGYRPQDLQAACKDGVENQDRDENAKPASELFSCPKVYAPHTTGGAFDVEIWSLDHSKILPTKFSNREETRGSYFIETMNDLGPEDEEARKNRRLLHHLLASPLILGKNHFVAHPSEYWHFGRNERLSAFLCLGIKEHEVFYDVT